MNDKNAFYFKGLGKTAFSVAFGLTVGKAVGSIVVGAINGGLTGVIKIMAKRGNAAAQDALNAVGMNYNKEDPEE